MMTSAVMSAISRELQCNQQLILGVSNGKTMSFGLLDTTAFCLRAKIQQMLFVMEITSRKLQYIQSRATTRKLQCTQSQATVFCLSSRRKSWCRKSRRSEELQPGAKNPVDKESNAKKQRNNQSQSKTQPVEDDVPVASYSAHSHRLQCFAYPVAGNPGVGKADVVKSCNQAQRIQSTKNPTQRNRGITSRSRRHNQ
ncbi:hypothetical protein F511_30102 [Dorcoceras hygrometricum]|uniref:Uncharacterized protein n=1 Tax=Dorcoceras hygrometricum TaxID=472368 RepID=A0A2Z7CRM5_9LAMI|nr:hypothetical protein F511_30102 [Dorcoceras hygrometricum]